MYFLLSVCILSTLIHMHRSIFPGTGKTETLTRDVRDPPSQMASVSEGKLTTCYEHPSGVVCLHTTMSHVCFVSYFIACHFVNCASRDIVALFSFLQYDKPIKCGLSFGRRLNTCWAPPTWIESRLLSVLLFHVTLLSCNTINPSSVG